VAALERVPPFVFVIEINYAPAPQAPTSGTTTTFGRDFLSCDGSNREGPVSSSRGLADRFLGRAEGRRAGLRPAQTV